MTSCQQKEVSAYSLLTKETLTYLYTQLKKTDKEIADFLNVDRTYITKARKDFGVKSRISTGRIGEMRVIKALKSQGFKVEDMNLKDKLHSFDLFVDRSIRIEVKSAKFNPKYDRYYFVLSEQAKMQNAVNDKRIMLKNGRTKKIFSKTCDFIIFVCIGVKEDVFYILPSDLLPNESSMLNIKIGYSFEKYRNNWDLLRKR